MMNIKRIQPKNNLDNIPHMLKTLACAFEDGTEEVPKTAFLICVKNNDSQPDLFQFGQEGSRLEEVGVFTACIHRLLKE